MTLSRKVVLSEARSFLQLDQSKYDTIYIDPPFNTGATQVSARGKQAGSYPDRYDDYCEWLFPHIDLAWSRLNDTGCIFVHLDQHEVFDVKVKVMDKIFGRKNFLNHIVWSYDYGGRGKDRWPTKHDDILLYVKDHKRFVFDWEACERIPYMAPELQKDPERAARGKVPTDVWWMSIVGTQSKERNGYPTQKPEALVRRALQPTTPRGGCVLDFFAGSGTTGAAAESLGLSWTLVDSNPQAIQVMRERFVSVSSATEWCV